MVHGALGGISLDFEGQYYPMEEMELAALGLHRCYLEHKQVCYPDRPETEKVVFQYSGIPEPDGFDCRLSGYAWITEID